MTDTFQIGIIAAFSAGTVSFLSPCVLPLVPGYISYVAGHAMQGASAPIAPTGRLRTVGPGAPTVQRGMVVLATYSLGLGLPFLIAAAFTDRLLKRLKSTGRIGRA